MIEHKLRFSPMEIYSQVSGKPHGPWIVLLHSLGCSSRLWDDQIPIFDTYFRVLRLDLPGHGRSGLPPEIGLMCLTDLLLLTLNQQHIEKAYFCGISLGGLVAQDLAIRHPDRVLGLVLANTGAKIGSEQAWNERVQAVAHRGLAPLVPSLTSRWLTPEFAASHPQKLKDMAEVLRQTNLQGYIMACRSLAAADLRTTIDQIKAPTMVIAGDQDLATPVADAEFLVSHISGARLEILKAAHISNVEQPAAFADLVLSHCLRIPPGQKSV